MAIPKIIHYCWFGPKDISDLELQCIRSWKEHFPDYELKFWNESDVDISQNPFAKQAYEAEKFAFVSDYVRTKVLYEYGGLYLDTDVEVLTKFSDMLSGHKAVVGFETSNQIGTAVMAFEPKSQLLKEFLKVYNNIEFKTDGGLNITANVGYLTDLLVERGLKIDGNEQKIGDILVTKRELFFPKRLAEDEFKITPDTVAVHRCRNSWMSPEAKRRGKNKFWINIARPVLLKIKAFLGLLLDAKKVRKIEIRLRNWLN